MNERMYPSNVYKMYIIIPGSNDSSSSNSSVTSFILVSISSENKWRGGESVYEVVYQIHSNNTTR